MTEGPSLPEMAELSVRLDPMGLCYSTRAHPGGVQREVAVSRPGSRETECDLGRMERSPAEGPTESRCPMGGPSRGRGMELVSFQSITQSGKMTDRQASVPWVGEWACCAECYLPLEDDR